MKNSTIILIFVLLVASSCEKSSLKNDLEDKWELLAIDGGIHGSGMESNFDFLEIVNNRSYEILRDESIIEDGEYTIYKVEEDFAGSYWKIEFDRNHIVDPEAKYTSEGYFWFHSTDTLIISDGLIDGFSWIFRRE